MLGQENDAYEENTKFIEGNIEMYKDLDDMNEQQKKQQIKELQEQRDNLIKQKEDLGFECTQIDREFCDI